MKRILGLAFLLFGTIPMISEGASDKPIQGGTLTMAIAKDIVLLNPLVATRSTEQAIRELMFEPLLGIDLRGNLQPNLAERWEASKDGKSYTFFLRRGVKFHDGREMTAEDVKFAMDYSMNPKNGAYGLAKLSLVERVAASDRYALTVHLKNASPAFLTSLTTIQAFSVIPKGSLKEGVDKPGEFPPGTGAFRFVEWKPRQRIVLERHNDYWGHKAFLDRVILRPVPDDTVRITALRSGDIDMAERTAYEWAKQIADGKLKGVRAVKAANAGFRRLVFNTAGPPFNNKRLRQAVAHAIDKREILDAAYFGFGDPVDQRYPSGHSWYLPGLPSPRYDPERAKALLQEAGYKGEPIPIMTNQGVDEAESTTLQAQLRKIGMNITLDVVDHGSYTTRTRSGDFAIKFSGGNYDPDPSLTYDLICPADPRKRTANASAYCDKELDRLMARAETEIDAEKRREILKQMIAKVLDDAPELYIGFVPRFFAVRDSVKGFTTNDEGGFFWWGGGLNRAWLER
jgi:ABC-type transport system substrate-binding protein